MYLPLYRVDSFAIVHGMKTLRIVLGILALFSLALLADKLFFHLNEYDEDSLRTMAFMVFGVPILVLNFWAWVYPEIIEFYFLGKDIKLPQ